MSGEFRRVRATDGDEAERTTSARQAAVFGRDPPSSRNSAHTLVMGLAGLFGAEVLEQERHAAKRAIGERPCGLAQSAVELAMDDRVEPRVERFDARAIARLDELDGRHRTIGHELGQARCVVVVEEISTVSQHQFGMRPPLTMIVCPDTNTESSDRK